MSSDTEGSSLLVNMLAAKGEKREGRIRTMK